MRSALRWQVPSPIGLIFQIIGRRFVLQLAANQALQRAKNGRRDGCARNNCRVNRCNPIANQRNAGSVCDYVVAACEPIEFIGRRPE